MMDARNTGTGRRGFMPVLLRLCACLCVFLVLFSAAAGETASSSWEDRLVRAREKYNEKTVNVYRRGKGKVRNGMINICVFPLKKKPYIKIRESLKITDEAEMEAILEQLVKSGECGDEYGSVSFMKAQWITHNLVHSMATGDDEQRELVGSILGEDLKNVVYHARELDLSRVSDMSEKQRLVYGVVEMLFCTNPGG